jgi:hypothetical protein
MVNLLVDSIEGFDPSWGLGCCACQARQQVASLRKGAVWYAKINTETRQMRFLCPMHSNPNAKIGGISDFRGKVVRIVGRIQRKRRQKVEKRAV